MLPASSPPPGAVEVPARTRTFDIPAWSRLTNAQRVAIISRIGRDASQDPRIRRLAVSIFRASGVEPRDYEGQASAILKTLQDRLFFVNEGDGRGAGEVLQDPAYTLDLQPDGTIGPRASGDCDDFASTAVALLESVHLPARLVTSGRVGARRIRWVEGVGRSPPGVAWSHIYVTVAPRPFRNKAYNAKTWRFFDATVSGAPLGWDCVSNGQGDPQLGDTLGDAEVVEGITFKTAASLVAVSIVSAFVVGRMQKAGWL